MWGAIVRGAVLMCTGFILGGVAEPSTQVLVQPVPSQAAALDSGTATESASPLFIVSCALLVVAVGHLVWTFRRRP